MAFTAQPYPLYAAYWTDDKLAVAVIVGWASPNSDNIDSSRIQPVALLQNDDGSATEPKYIELDGGDPYWVDTTVAGAISAAAAASEAVST